MTSSHHRRPLTHCSSKWQPMVDGNVSPTTNWSDAVRILPERPQSSLANRTSSWQSDDKRHRQQEAEPCSRLRLWRHSRRGDCYFRRCRRPKDARRAAWNATRTWLGMPGAWWRIYTMDALLIDDDVTNCKSHTRWGWPLIYVHILR